MTTPFVYTLLILLSILLYITHADLIPWSSSTLKGNTDKTNESSISGNMKQYVFTHDFCADEEHIPFALKQTFNFPFQLDVSSYTRKDGSIAYDTFGLSICFNSNAMLPTATSFNHKLWQLSCKYQTTVSFSLTKEKMEHVFNDIMIRQGPTFLTILIEIAPRINEDPSKNSPPPSISYSAHIKSSVCKNGSFGDNCDVQPYLVKNVTFYTLSDLVSEELTETNRQHFKQGFYEGIKVDEYNDQVKKHLLLSKTTLDNEKKMDIDINQYLFESATFENPHDLDNIDYTRNSDFQLSEDEEDIFTLTDDMPLLLSYTPTISTTVSNDPPLIVDSRLILRSSAPIVARLSTDTIPLSNYPSIFVDAFNVSVPLNPKTINRENNHLGVNDNQSQLDTEIDYDLLPGFASVLENSSSISNVNTHISGEDEDFPYEASLRVIVPPTHYSITKTQDYLTSTIYQIYTSISPSKTGVNLSDGEIKVKAYIRVRVCYPSSSNHKNVKDVCSNDIRTVSHGRGLVIDNPNHQTKPITHRFAPYYEGNAEGNIYNEKYPLSYSQLLSKLKNTDDVAKWTLSAILDSAYPDPKSKSMLPSILIRRGAPPVPPNMLGGGIYDAILSYHEDKGVFYTSNRLGDMTGELDVWYVTYIFETPVYMMVSINKKCPNNCSQHGKCELVKYLVDKEKSEESQSNSDISQYDGKSKNNLIKHFEDLNTPNLHYFKCTCDSKYQGLDCSIFKGSKTFFTETNILIMVLAGMLFVILVIIIIVCCCCRSKDENQKELLITSEDGYLSYEHYQPNEGKSTNDSKKNDKKSILPFFSKNKKKNDSENDSTYDEHGQYNDNDLSSLSSLHPTDSKHQNSSQYSNNSSQYALFDPKYPPSPVQTQHNTSLSGLSADNHLNNTQLPHTNVTNNYKSKYTKKSKKSKSKQNTQNTSSEAEQFASSAYDISDAVLYVPDSPLMSSSPNNTHNSHYTSGSNSLARDLSILPDFDEMYIIKPIDINPHEQPNNKNFAFSPVAGVDSNAGVGVNGIDEGGEEGEGFNDDYNAYYSTMNTSSYDLDL